MYQNVGFKDSVTPDNGYQFHCPVVDRDALFIACAFMRAKFMRGENFAAHDCRCAMAGSKCPAVRMLRREWQAGERQFFESTPTKRMLPKDLVEDIQKVVLLPSMQGQHPVTPEQAKRLFEDGIVVRRVSGEIIPPESIPANAAPTRTRRAKTKVETTPTVATPTGADLGEMINQALNDESPVE